MKRWTINQGSSTVNSTSSTRAGRLPNALRAQNGLPRTAIYLQSFTIHTSPVLVRCDRQGFMWGYTLLHRSLSLSYGLTTHHTSIGICLVSSRNVHACRIRWTVNKCCKSFKFWAVLSTWLFSGYVTFFIISPKRHK